MGRFGLAWAAMVACTLVAGNAWPEEGAAPETVPADRVMAKAQRRLHPPKKRGQWRIRRDFDETADFLDELQAKLDTQDLLVGFDAAVYNQYASRVREGSHNAATFAWQLFIDYEVYATKEHGDFHLTGTFLGSVGLDYSANSSLSERVGSVSVLNGNVVPNAGAIDELYAHWVSKETEWFFAVGKIDMSFFFDTNRVANDAYRQFTGFALENDLSIPFPDYGSLGFIGRWNPTRNIYVMVGGGDATSDERVLWGKVTAGSWWELVEAGFTFEPKALGTGNYRITGWHSDRGPGNGFGIGINIDQDLGREWLVGFFRAGVGDETQTNIETAISGGLSFQEPFGRQYDEAGIGISWAQAVDDGRDETYLEGFYRYSFTKRLSVSPFLQIVVDPAENPEDTASVVGGVRVLWML